MASINVDGLTIIVSNGKAKLSSRSRQASNPNMYRPGSAQYERALRNQAKANRILNSFNSTGSYVNSSGMRTYINRGKDGGQFKQQADRGTEAWRTQKQIAKMGGLKSQPISVDGEENEEDEENKIIEEMIDKMWEEVAIIEANITQKIQGYFNQVSEATSNIGQSIVDIFTD